MSKVKMEITIDNKAAPFGNCLLLIFVVFTTLLMSCSQQSSNNLDNSIYVANIITDESTTKMQLIQLVDKGGDTPAAYELGSWDLNVGAMKFALNQGSVPEGSALFPKECQGRTDLGPTDAVTCLYEPLLGLSSGVLLANGLDNGDVSVVMSYGTDGDTEYPPDAIEDLDDAISDGISNELGFMVEPDIDTPESEANSDFQSYYHDSSMNYPRPDWMSGLDPERTFTKLSLPGTHDSAAYQRGGDAVETQSMNLMNQLWSGIRAFDIRLKCTDDGKYLVAFHGSWYQNANLDDILTTMTQFLDSHAKEALFVRIKNEANEQDKDDGDGCAKGANFWSIFDTYYNRYGRIWRPTDTRNPNLKDVQGRIVVMQMSGGNKYGIPFGSGGNGIGYWQSQDDFVLVDNDALYTKWLGGTYHLPPVPKRYYKGVKPHFYEANYRTNLTAMYVNFLSGSTGSFPYFVAGGRCPHGTNAARLWTGIAGPKKKKDHLYPDYYHHYYGSKGAPQVSIYYNGTNEMSFQWMRNNHPKYTGIVYADFPGKDLIGEIILANFP